MLEELIQLYKKLFIQEAHEALLVVVNYLLRNNKTKTKAELAKKTGISASTLTAYLSGDKVISKIFIKRLEIVYGVDIYNPLTYQDSGLYEALLSVNHPPIDANTYITVMERCRRIIEAQQVIIEGLRISNKGLRKMNAAMYGFLLTHAEKVTTGAAGIKIPVPEEQKKHE